MKLSFWLAVVLGVLILLLWGSIAAQPFVPPPGQEPLPMLRGEPIPMLRGEPVRPWPGPMSVRMDVLVDGQPVQTVSYLGRTYLPVPRRGAEYEIRVSNSGPRRIVAIVSVDGLSVINGQKASENQPGYVVASGSSVTIKGWRRDLDRVAAFRFVDREDAYASRMGQPENIGVIGLIAVEEFVPRLMPMDQKYSDAAGSYARSPRAEVGSIGTEYGRDITSGAYYVPFVRSSNKRTVTVYYDSVEELRRIGVPVDRPYPIPFPGGGPFAPPPPGHRG
jgi:hypothetical protein